MQLPQVGLDESGKPTTNSPGDIEDFVNLHFVTFDPNDIGLCQIQLLSAVKLHTRFGEHWAIDLGRVVE
jgi:hypothetical protein